MNAFRTIIHLPFRFEQRHLMISSFLQSGFDTHKREHIKYQHNSYSVVSNFHLNFLQGSFDDFLL
jgi:hypothetical protein